MSDSQTLPLIISLAAAFLSSGGLGVVISMKANNRKTEAETNRIKRETKQIDTNEGLEFFKAQIDAANKLSESASKRLTELSNQVTSDEEQGRLREARIKDLEQESALNRDGKTKLSIKLIQMVNLFTEFLSLIDKHVLYHEKAILEGRQPDFDQVANEFRRNVADINRRFEDLKKDT